MTSIKMKSDAAQKIYDNYAKRIKRISKVLSSEDQNDLLKEIESHVYEGMERSNRGDEVSGLMDVLERLGEPEDFLKPLVAKKKMDQALTTFNPKHVFQGLALNIGKGFKSILFSILYLFLFTFVGLIALKIAFPKKTGLFYLDGEFMGFGFIQDHALYGEVMGWWFIPTCLLGAGIFYLVVTLLMKLFHK